MQTFQLTQLGTGRAMHSAWVKEPDSLKHAYGENHTIEAILVTEMS